ncbi:MAG: hypothetical protein K0M56_08595 [Kaistella sp.]|nr:hypothetical protein [Kaistella sp.]
MYDGKFLGFNAIVNNDIFMNVTYLGESEYEKITLKKSNKDFKNDGFWLYSSLDEVDQVGKGMNSRNYPFKIDKEIQYYLYDGKTGKKNIRNEIVLGDKFQELIFSTGGANISIDKKNINFAFNAAGVGKTSLSFIVYKDRLYVVNMYPLGSSEFKTLHSFYKKQ